MLDVWRVRVELTSEIACEIPAGVFKFQAISVAESNVANLKHSNNLSLFLQLEATLVFVEERA